MVVHLFDIKITTALTVKVAFRFYNKGIGAVNENILNNSYDKEILAT